MVLFRGYIQVLALLAGSLLQAQSSNAQPRAAGLANSRTSPFALRDSRPVSIQPAGVVLPVDLPKVSLADALPAPERPKKELERTRFDAPILRQDEGFFPRDAAQTTFHGKVIWNKKRELEYFPAMRPVSEEEQAEQELVLSDPKAKKLLPDAESILKEYGDPSQDVPVLAQPDAPTPFKGLMAALQIKDDKLAFQYARQWARYITNVNNRTMKVTGLTGLALKREGGLEDGTWADDPQYSQYRYLLDDDLKAAEKQKNSALEMAASMNLDSKMREMLERAREEEEMNPSAKSDFTALGSPEDDEKLERLKVRKQLGATVPVDPQGKVDVFFFLKLRDNNSLAMAGIIEAFYRAVAKDGQVSFSAISLENVSADQIKQFHIRTNTTFPIAQADMMAQVFKVDSAPTTVFLTHTTNRAIVNEGMKSYVYLDELLKAMRGEK